ncbi:MAG: ABC transporter substrate-binding protein [Rhizobiales bacterium NRL2]|jgi:branched-chain amino acid transport system substrate-binding protein|nr:MAG: ABC transporter substrate-binding protein [Rhizobiales bacterium NRL2]
MLKKTLTMAAGLAMLGSAVQADDQSVDIGFVTTLTVGPAVIGRDMTDAVDLAVEHLGGTMAGKKINVIYEDDGFKPEIGKQKTEKLVNSDNVDFVAGYIWSNVLLASYKSVVGNGPFLISSNAGPSQIAGKLCHEDFFSTSWQNDQTPMAMGEVLNQRGVKSVYIMAPNYAAGKNMVEGVERTYKGEIVGKDMTKWPGQLDFSAELAKARASGAEAVFVFYPGKAGVQFFKQYEQAGLKSEIPLYSAFTVDAISLPLLKDLAVGSLNTQSWSPDLDNATNKKFVADYKAKTGRFPSFYAAQSYDTILLINSAVEAVNGDLSDKAGMRAAMKKADFESTRGRYSYGNNHFPIQNFYLREAYKNEAGEYTVKTVQTVFENHQDSYASECGM